MRLSSLRIGSVRIGLLSLAGGLVLLQHAVSGQEPVRDPRLEELRTEIGQLSKRLDELEKTPIGQLNRTIADQERRIAALEKTVRTLQGAGPAPRPDWHAALNWALIRNGMSEKQVVDLLGPPTRVQSVVDVRTLYYQPDPRSVSTQHGSVTLKGDRVTASETPEF